MPTPSSNNTNSKPPVVPVAELFKLAQEAADTSKGQEARSSTSRASEEL
jgi:hypothetical protein